MNKDRGKNYKKKKKSQKAFLGLSLTNRFSYHVGENVCAKNGSHQNNPALEIMKRTNCGGKCFPSKIND